MLGSSLAWSAASCPLTACRCPIPSLPRRSCAAMACHGFHTPSDIGVALLAMAAIVAFGILRGIADRAGARVAGRGEVVRSNDSRVIHPQTVDNVVDRLWTDLEASLAGPCVRVVSEPHPVDSAPLRSPDRWSHRSEPISETALGDSFTHLHVHTEYSMLDGAARVDEVVAAAAADGQPAIGITDHGNMYGVLPFYKACQDHGIKPGRRASRPTWPTTTAHERTRRRGKLDDTGGEADGGKKAYYHLTLLAESNVGYRNLIQLSSRAFMEGYYRKPKVDWELLDRPQRGRHRHHRLPRRPRPAVAAAPATTRRRSRRRAASRRSSGATTSSSSCRTTASPSSTAPTRSWSTSPGASARRCSPPTTATTPSAERRRGPRRPAVRPDRRPDSQPTRSGSSSTATATT